MNKEQVAAELRAIYEANHAIDPHVAVAWAKEHPDSALYARLDWNDTSAAHAYRLLQMRNIITEVEVVYPDGKPRQVYVSPIESRGQGGGYVALVDVMSDAERKQRFLAQALDEYLRLGAKYESLKELAGVRAAVERAQRRPAARKAA